MVVHIPAGLHVVFRSKLDGTLLWVHLRSAVGLHERLHWYVSSGSNPKNKLTPSDNSANSAKMQIDGVELHDCLRRFAVANGRGVSKSWVVPANVLYSRTSNWFTSRLQSDRAMARIREVLPRVDPTALTLPHQGEISDIPLHECRRRFAVDHRHGMQNSLAAPAGVLCRPTEIRFTSHMRSDGTMAPNRVVLPPVDPTAATLPQQVKCNDSCAGKRLEAKRAELSEVRNVCKRLRLDNQRLRASADEMRSALTAHVAEVGVQGCDIRTVVTDDLVAECVTRAREKGVAPSIGLQFVSSFLANSARSKSRWR